ncbi:MAG TPA: DUF3467 domain-containing protein [Pirellulales bacterium]|jgi:hypothetical protein|nr:DUF3467 domain-containing protein [Pirellulales bacterium]
MAASAHPEPLTAVQDREAQSLYANFCRVLDSGDELVLDFGLHVELGAAKSLIAPQRIALSPYTAKRLCEALKATLETYERNFGPLKTDIQDRLVSRPV